MLLEPARVVGDRGRSIRSAARTPENGRHGHRPSVPSPRQPCGAGTYDTAVPVYICPNCKNRSVDIDGFEGFSGSDALQCRRCGFGFIFQLLEDYYPAPSTGFIVCDRDARVLAAGRGVFELTGFQEGDLMGRDVGDGAHALRSEADRRRAGVGRAPARPRSSSSRRGRRFASRSPSTSSPPTTRTAGLLVALTPRTPATG